MKSTYLVEFEEVVLLTIAVLPQTQAYRVTLTQEIEKQTGREVPINNRTTIKEVR
jgi:hypothetical protein